MLRGLVTAFILLTLISLSIGGITRAGELCGRQDYPSPNAYTRSGIQDQALWSAFLAAHGFENGTGGQTSIEARVAEFPIARIIILQEITAAGVPSISLTVREEGPGGEVVTTYAFRTVEVGRTGGNLSLVAWRSNGLEVFWRWAYLACDPDFPAVYSIFHARIDGGVIADDNSPVYFEAIRPRRAPPADLILVVVAGGAASAIFLSARRALRKSPPSDTRDRTIK